MKKTQYREDHKEALDRMLGAIPGVESGKMFGFPAYYTGGKLFACVYGYGLGVKLPQSLAEELLKKGRVVPFRPLGRPKMKEWVQLNRARPSDYERDRDVFDASIEYVTSLARKRSRD